MSRALLRAAVGVSLTTVFACGDRTPAAPAPGLVVGAISEGYDVPGSTGRATFTSGDQVFYQGGRGFSVAKLDSVTGRLQDVQSFDTWATRDDGTALRAFVASMADAPSGTLLLIAVGDEAGLNTFPPAECEHWPYPWVDDALRALEALGSRQIRSYCYRDSWAMAVVKGEGRARAEAWGKGIAVSVRVAVPVTGR